MNDLEERCFKILEYGVELFKYHADQRLRCIRYFTAIVAAFIVGAIVGVDQIIERHGNLSLSSSPIVGILLLGFIFASAGVTLFFWLLDIRNRVLTEYAEDSLKKTENILFGKNNKSKTWNIVTQCENRTKAWHYGQILPIFFIIIILFLFAISIFITFFYCNSDSCICWICTLSILFNFALLLMLICGLLAEKKFRKK